MFFKNMIFNLDFVLNYLTLVAMYLINYGIIQLKTDFFVPKRQICLIRNPLHPQNTPAKILIDMLKGSATDPLFSYSTDSGISF